MLTEEGFGQRVNGRMLSEDGLCKAFDARADGYGRADGCVALLIEQVNVTIENMYV
uniref:Beta-ketoacyl synthase N-terminal domain-containing protein n=1 Tax=Parascaris equorum TaxID=6256 RepID=A0A914S3N4_PAREQ